MTTDQIRAILEKIEEGGSSLNKLMLGDSSYGALMGVDTALVIMILGKLGNSIILINLTYLTSNKHSFSLYQKCIL